MDTNEVKSALDEFKGALLGRISKIEQKSGTLDADLTKMSKEMADLTLTLQRPNGGTRGEHGGAETKAFLDFVRTGRESPELKSMSTLSDPDGGYTVPPEIERQLTKYLRARSPMRQVARVVPVSGLEYQQIASTLGTGYAWVGETAARPETDTPKFKAINIPTREVYAQPALTQTLLDDNDFDLENWLIQELGDAFGDAESVAFISGDGVARPRGLFTYPVVATADATRAHTDFQYVPTGGSGAWASSNPSDALISLVYAVKSQYRQNAAWLMSPEVIEDVRLFKTGTTSEYLWRPGTEAGQPATLLGYPVYEDENLPAIAANSLSAAFGDFSRAYTVTDRSTKLLRDPYTNKPYVNFYATKRVGGGGGRDTRAVKFLKFASS